MYETDEDDYYWLVVLENCAAVKFPNERIRFAKSYTLGRGLSDEQMRKIVAPD